ncbi:MAG: Mur ligase domain-containing protein [Prevotellaceae bacterium]|jgi:UDP-N-acetylmuramate: L-alanyl-gamma-D-glutamyl-meso-diaminopimelate ligase|nr:Mur ligase domain-containing protein [Prevotellaceae bacterium]
MKKVHFIAIGGAAMHNLALAMYHKGYEVSGSDNEVFEPSRSRLSKYGLLPAETGWFPEKITPELDAVILGMHAQEDNPELLRAKELGIKIYSFPEYLYEQTQDKKRVVIGGSHGKTTITAMILFVLQKLGIKFDYMVGAQIEGFDTMVGLSDEAHIAIFEGDEYLTSPIDLRPKFHLYRPHVALLSGIAWDHINVFPTFDNYVEQFRIFASLIEPNGKLIYYKGDENLSEIAKNVRNDIEAIPYDTHTYVLENGKTFLINNNEKIEIAVFGEHNLQNLNGARLVCRQLGVSDNDFYRAISGFAGAANRLQKIAGNEYSAVYKDFAHSPSKLRATVKAMKNQFPERKLVACMELHTFSSLNKDFLPQYKNCMKDADIAFVYFNPEVVEHKHLETFTKEQVAEAFGGENLRVFDDAELLKQELQKIDFHNKNLLIMTSGNFSGMDIVGFTSELIK